MMVLQRSLDALAAASALVHAAHRPAIAPATAGSSSQTQALLSACLSAMPARAPAYQRVPVLHTSRSLGPSILPMLPAPDAVPTVKKESVEDRCECVCVCVCMCL